MTTKIVEHKPEHQAVHAGLTPASRERAMTAATACCIRSASAPSAAAPSWIRR
ncbi:hypothetical protein [Streptomyces sp. NPDC020298]|uniref:hypothetical protein n=1 Tax=unclassified Streptomyces TaxID=2593676 RepID=UPI0033C207BD